MADPLAKLTTIQLPEVEAIRMPASVASAGISASKGRLLTSRTERKMGVLHVQDGLWERCACLKDQRHENLAWEGLRRDPSDSVLVEVVLSVQWGQQALLEGK